MDIIWQKCLCFSFILNFCYLFTSFSMIIQWIHWICQWKLDTIYLLNSFHLTSLYRWPLRSRSVDDNVWPDVRLDASDVDVRVCVCQLKSEERRTFLQPLSNFRRRRLKQDSDETKSPIENFDQSYDWNASEKTCNRTKGIIYAMFWNPSSHYVKNLQAKGKIIT
jgi:hypothetical protein